MIGILVQLAFFVVLLFGVSRKNINYSEVFSRDVTNTIRFACCIPVMISHIKYPGTHLVLGYPHFVYVTIFFLLSGYGLTLSYLKDREAFVKKQPGRILKIAYPLVFVLILEFLFKTTIGGAGLWWFDVLILLYIIYGIGALIFSNKYHMLIFNCVLVIGYSIYYQFVISANGIEYFWVDYFGWAQQSIGFILGIMLALWRDKILSFIDKNKIWLSIVSIICVAPAAYKYLGIHETTKGSNEIYILRMIISLVGLLLLFIAIMHFSIGNKLTVYVGNKLSVYIFAIHGLFLGIADDYMFSVDGNLKLLFIVVGSFVGAFCMYALNELVTKLIHKKA